MDIGSKSGPNQVRAEGFGWVGAGRVGPGERVPVAPLESLYTCRPFPCGTSFPAVCGEL